jgi:hypothetical protein
LRGEGDIVTANRRNQTGWRRLTGWLAAYCLVLHLFFAGLATSHVFALDTAGIALCAEHADGGSPAADGPFGHRQGKIHCAFCPAAMHGNATIEPPAALPLSFAAVGKPAWRFNQPSRLAELKHLCNGARAPPPEV